MSDFNVSRGWTGIMDAPDPTPAATVAPPTGQSEASGAVSEAAADPNTLFQLMQQGKSIYSMARNLFPASMSGAAGSAGEAAAFSHAPFEALGAAGITEAGMGALVPSSFGVPVTAAAAGGGAGWGSLATGPGGFVFGTILGEVLGKVLGDKTKPRIELITQQTDMTGGFEDGYYVSSKLGEVGLGGKSHGVDARESSKLIEMIVGIDDFMADKIGDVGINAIQEGTLSVNHGEMVGYRIDDPNPDNLFYDRYMSFLKDAAPVSEAAALALSNVEKIEEVQDGVSETLSTFFDSYKDARTSSNSPYSYRTGANQASGISGWKSYVNDHMEDILDAYEGPLGRDDMIALINKDATEYTAWEAKVIPKTMNGTPRVDDPDGFLWARTQEEMDREPGLIGGVGPEEFLAAMTAGLNGQAINDDLTFGEQPTDEPPTAVSENPPSITREPEVRQAIKVEPEAVPPQEPEPTSFDEAPPTTATVPRDYRRANRDATSMVAKYAKNATPQYRAFFDSNNRKLGLME